MLLFIVAVIVGLAILVWSADRFVDGASGLAKHLGVPALLIGILIIGFGTSAPEIVVSIISAMQGNPGLALGNAYGSNIANIALVLGITALISPIAIHSQIIRKEFPVLLAVTAVSVLILLNGWIGVLEGMILLTILAILVGISIWQAKSGKDDSIVAEVEQELAEKTMTRNQSIFWVVVGLILLIISSRLLVWGAVGMAQAFGVSDLIIGLTIVAIGTSLPELVSSIAAARKGEHDMILGNIIGSNLFNTLAVVGIAAVIHPLAVASDVLTRDIPVMVGLTILLFVMCWRFKLHQEGKQISRAEGGGLLLIYAGYTVWLIQSAILAS
ncbi:MAG: calcium/sodium antiporter [Pseudomonadota bacterium]|nr:calcium/sodium antiporter [Pseudomonadota bacterium]